MNTIMLQWHGRSDFYHRPILAGVIVTVAAATWTTTLFSHAHAHTPTILVFPQKNQCLIPDDDGKADATSSPSLLKIQKNSLSCGDRRYNDDAIHHNCRGGTKDDGGDDDLKQECQQEKHQQQSKSLEKDEKSSPILHQKYRQYLPPNASTRLVIEFDTHAMMSGGVRSQRDDTKLSNRIRKRIAVRDGTEGRRRHHQQQQQQQLSPHSTIRQFPSLSISLDVNPVSSSNTMEEVDSTLYYESKNSFHDNNETQTLVLSSNVVQPLAPIPTIVALLTQTVSLLPPLILARRTLNFTWTAIVDYFRGRTIRTTFTKLERAYLRYYEFPAMTRAIARIGSQIGILFGLSWIVRLWMIWVCSSNGSSIMMLGITAGNDNIRSVGLSGGGGGGGGGRTELIGPGLKVGLPCHQRGKGIAWLCGFVWIGAVVGIGHACAIALSVWGGPLRLQATAQHAENPKMFFRRLLHHPIIWLSELDEWKYYSSLELFHQTVGRNKSDGNFNPDPLLFPATWLPLRWLQIFALAKAFSTNPLKYRWCSEECGKDVIRRLMKQYLVQLALGDEWHRVFLGEKRVGLGIIVVISYFIALGWMVITTFTLDGGAAAMLIPSVLAAIISVVMNFMIFWNRLGTRDQRKALNAMGLA